MFAALLIIATLAVGYYNGANDVSKAIATLVGSGVTRYKTAVAWGSLWTFAGASTAIFASQGLVTAFSGKGILIAPPIGDGFLLATAVGALSWIWFATRTGLPVSTTHALTGALVGAGVAASGWAGINSAVLMTKFALPLAVGPVLALVLVFAVYPFVHGALARWQGYCVCVQRPVMPSCSDGAVCLTAGPSTIVAGSAADCDRAPGIVADLNFVDGLHWITAGTTAFARGLNDAPKVLGLGIAASLTLSVPPLIAFLAVAVAMTAGSLLRGMRVTETLAEKVTPMTPLEGLAANAVTSLLVVLAVFLALPVSTTHVSSGAIIGLGLKHDARRVRWKTVREMLLAWVITLPFAAVVAAILYRIVLS